jgi:type VI secretion system secreted protein Hcp
MFALSRHRLLPVAVLVVALAALAWWAVRPASEAAPAPARIGAPAAGTLVLVGLPGASGDTTLPIKAFAMGASNSGGFSSGGGGGAGRANLQDISVTVDTSTIDPLLLRAVTTGSHLQRATFTVDGGAQEWRLDDVLVTSASWGGDAKSETFSLSFAYRKVQLSSLDRHGAVVSSSCYDVVAAATC